MADITISTSRQSCKPDCNQLIIIEQPIMNKYSEIDESPSTDTDEPVQQSNMSVTSNTMKITKMIQNKLKRKKKLSNSLTSVSDTVNQEKRTRIEGIQLNCRGKLNEELIAAATSPPTTPSTAMGIQQQPLVKLERVQLRTPLPSPRVAEKIILLQQSHQQQQQHPPMQQQMAKVPPPRLKRKLEENMSTIQRLNAQTEQMRLEIAELKTHLSTERGAVRVLRAQNESETRKWKNEVKKLQTAMELMRKVKKSKEEACANWSGNNNSSSSVNGAKDANITNHELQRLTNEITTLREANRNLEEKLQISNDAERRKAADLRELKDSYEIRLTQLSKSAKTEISRLLEEIKTKERNIGQLKKETQTLQKHKTNQTINNKKDTHTRNTAQRPSEMKKLKDIERNKNNNNINNCHITNKNNTNNEKCFINTTCGEKEFHSMPHEFTERILEAHNDAHAYRSKQDHQNSDSDSALSSAPPSISPQPPPTGMEPADIWQTIRNYTKDIEKVQNDLESIQKENEALQKELNLAKQQILESEKTAIEATNNAKMQQKLLDRVKYLEQKENELQEETHELREQNELLEFRILELEESNDKWSLQSNTTPNSKNVWSNGGKESDDAIIFTDRSDSGVTSPHSHHHIDDRINVISPCDLNLLDHMTNDDLRRRLSQMVKKTNIDEDDKMCLQQVLAFIQNLDVMSHDSLPSSEESSSLEYIKSRVSDYASTPRSADISSNILNQKPKSAPPTGRIVATVLPYSSTVSTPNDSPQRKLRAWHTSSLTESGVFEGDLSESSVYTQTEPEDFACLETATTNDLYTEIQKLNRFREKFEECATRSDSAKVPVQGLPTNLSPNLSDQKRIQYYKDRLDVLESKLLIYESSGDLQAKRLADRLQREIQLENLVKELRDRVDFLEVENSQLEEEKCEFEEAENDTRLRLQRLEVELEILSQRNIELEMSREALQNKLKDCRSESAILRDDLAACQTQVCHLEEDRYRYKENFEFLHSTIPTLVLFNTFFLTTTGMGNCMERNVVQPESTESDLNVAPTVCDCAMAVEEYKREIGNLREENICLNRKIDDINARNSEALACADGIWEDMEKRYNERLMASKSKEDSLKQKIKQLEDCLQDDSRAANEKICQLEDAERELRKCLQKVSRDHREIFQEHALIAEEYQSVKEKYERLREHVEGPIKETLERERTQCKNLKEELGFLRRTSCEQEMHYRNELDCFQLQLDKVHKELMQLQVTNSELREEVCTLENEITTLQEKQKNDIDRVRCLSDEVRTKEDMCIMLEKRIEALLSVPYNAQKNMRYSGRSPGCSGAVPSLAQELNGSPVKRIKMEDPVDLESATKNLGTVLSSIRDNSRGIPTHREFQNVANDVKKLAEALLANKSNAELLKSLEEKITAKLLKFHCMKMESEFRYRSTQDDRYRNNSNLSNHSNAASSTGRRQIIAEIQENQKAKDKDYYNDNQSEASSEKFYTPRGSYMCLCEKAGQRCNELCSRWGYHNHTNTAIKSSQTENHVQYSSPPILVQNENKPLVTCAVDTGDSSICSCEDTDEYSKSPIQSNTELNVFTSKDQCPWTESALQNCCRWIMEQANKTGIRLETTTNPCCEQTRVISRANSSIKPTSSEQQHADREQYCSCAEQQTCAEDCVGRQPCASEPCATPPCSPISTSFTEPPPHGPENPCQCPCCMAECCRKACCPFKQNSVEPQNSSIRSLPLPPVCSDIEQNIQTADKLLPILENIYEILQCIRDERLHQSIVSREQSEHQRDSDSLKKYCVDLPPPMPPPSPSFMRQLNFTHAPPLNIYISPMPTHRSNDPSSLQAAEELCAHVSLETPRYIEEREPMYALDPPERDVDVEEVARSEGNTRKLIPVDMDLMRADDDFELTPACRVSVECQVHTNSLEDIDINGCLRETSTQMLKFPVKKCLCTDAELKACLEACQKQREELDMKSCQRESKASRISSTVNVLSDQPGGEQERKASKISSTANVLSDQLGVEQASMMSKISSTINVSDQLGGKRASKTSKISSTINVLSDQPGVVKQASKTSKISSTINVLSDQPGVVKQASKTSKISSTINVSDQLEGERDSANLAQPRDSALNKPNTNTKVSSEQLLEEIQKSEPSEPVPSKPLETKPRHSESSSVNFRQTDYEHRISKLLSVDINNHPRNKSITSSQINFPLRTEDTVSNMCLISRLSKIDAGTDRPEFDYENKISSACQCQPEPTQVNLPEMCEFIDSILNDLEAMKLAREKSFGCQKPVKNPNQPNQWQTQSQQQQNQWQTQSQHQQSQWQKPPTGLSYPLTIEKVVQLGTNSLFVKWSVQNLNNIAGYEVFVDGHLTNRYFSPIHRAAVICEVKLHCQHRIIVRAQPAFICSDSIQSSCALSDDPSLSSYNPGASSPQPDGSIWYPSVYHFEPNIYSPPTNTDFNDSGVVKT